MCCCKVILEYKSEQSNGSELRVILHVFKFSAVVRRHGFTEETQVLRYAQLSIYVNSKSRGCTTYGHQPVLVFDLFKPSITAVCAYKHKILML